jgi:hypothetical protein
MRVMISSSSSSSSCRQRADYFRARAGFFTQKPTTGDNHSTACGVFLARRHARDSEPNTRRLNSARLGVLAAALAGVWRPAHNCQLSRTSALTSRSGLPKTEECDCCGARTGGLQCNCVDRYRGDALGAQSAARTLEKYLNSKRCPPSGVLD